MADKIHCGHSVELNTRIERLWERNQELTAEVAQLRSALGFTGLCSAHRTGEDPTCTTCYAVLGELVRLKSHPPCKWETDNQRAALERHGLLELEMGCDSISSVCEALVASRARCEQLQQELDGARVGEDIARQARDDMRLEKGTRLEVAQLNEAVHAAHDEAMQAVAKWSSTNEQRMRIGEQVVMLAQQGQEYERSQAVGTYQQLSEMEMLCGGTAIVALAKAHREAALAFRACYYTATGQVPLSGPDDTNE